MDKGAVETIRELALAYASELAEKNGLLVIVENLKAELSEYQKQEIEETKEEEANV